MNSNKKSIEDLKAKMIAHDYKTGDSWKNKFFKKKHYKKFDRVMFFHYLDLIQEIRDAAQEDDED